MALSKQRTSDFAWVQFLKWAEANHYTLLECKPYNSVHSVHAPRSAHYDVCHHDGTTYSMGVDVNWPAGGSEERKMLTRAVPVAQSLGVAVTFALKGTAGTAANHQTHLHADPFSYSNLGEGNFEQPTGDPTACRMQAALKFEPRQRDNLFGPLSRKRGSAVRMASRMHGGKHPHGIAFTQRVIGAKPTGEWDAQSMTKHDRAVARIQRVLGLRQTGVWDEATEDRWQAFLKKHGR
ncbi:hypothetical protein [Demequina rhizosphaerae]|uniref:hypothetical protein n=1 Tax=Demequina rhizosphaerae TaxID=1638985 RepID=UPI000783B2E6|nr:hypothetical protein [Demequina rhizosphaerae]